MHRLIIALVACSIWLVTIAPSQATVLAVANLQQQEDLLPPTRFWGDLTINGGSAAVGMNVMAFINGNECGARVTTEGGRYWVDVLSSTERPDCGVDGATVRFQVEGVQSTLQGRWQAGTFVNLDLFVTIGQLSEPDTAE